MKPVNGSAFKFERKLALKVVGLDGTLTIGVSRSVNLGLSPLEAAWAACSFSADLELDGGDRIFSVIESTFRDEGEAIHLVNESKALRVNFRGLTLCGIDKRHHAELLELLKEMRGVELRHTRDLFGFLRNDGSDVPEVFELPFPDVIEDDAE
ncbi:MAG: hypothetical protein KGI91_16160 [Burkholderiales bacterium]|nr:hypothetical protein [Burkholderiales bacterium]